MDEGILLDKVTRGHGEIRGHQNDPEDLDGNLYVYNSVPSGVVWNYQIKNPLTQYLKVI